MDGWSSLGLGVRLFMKGGGLPDGLHVNQIYWLIQEADKAPKSSKCYIRCEITDSEADPDSIIIARFI